MHKVGNIRICCAMKDTHTWLSLNVGFYSKEDTMANIQTCGLKLTDSREGSYEALYNGTLNIMNINEHSCRP